MAPNGAQQSQGAAEAPLTKNELKFLSEPDDAPKLFGSPTCAILEIAPESDAAAKRLGVRGVLKICLGDSSSPAISLPVCRVKERDLDVQLPSNCVGGRHFPALLGEFKAQIDSAAIEALSRADDFGRLQPGHRYRIYLGKPRIVIDETANSAGSALEEQAGVA